jgi:hypothetical protein
VAKEKKLDAEAISIEGDHGSSVPPAIKLSIAFLKNR